MCRGRWWNRSSLLHCDPKRIAVTWMNCMLAKAEMQHPKDSVVAGWEDLVGELGSVVAGWGSVVAVSWVAERRSKPRKGLILVGLFPNGERPEAVRCRGRRRLEKVPKRRKPK